MSQVIPTPDQIVAKVVNQGNIAEDAVLLEVVKGQIELTASACAGMIL